MFLIKKIKRKFSTQNNHANDLQKLNAIISQLSHDLKNNLVTIRSAAKNITHYVNSADSEANKDRIDTTVSNIDTKINHSMTILNMVHLFSVEKGDWPDDISNFSINDCIQQAIQNYPFSFSRKYFSLIELINPDADFLIKGNKVLINGIFYCLIKNAVSAMCSSGKGEAVVILEPANKQNKIHFKFSEVQRSDVSPEYDLFSLGTPNNPGNGLNFILDVVESMGGQVEFRQESNNMLKVTLIFQ